MHRRMRRRMHRRCGPARYRPDSPILRGVSFSVPAGSSCAVVGASGSGKSTILRLLFRCARARATQHAATCNTLPAPAQLPSASLSRLLACSVCLLCLPPHLPACLPAFRPPRFYDAEAGAVRVGGADVRDLQLASLRQAIAIVPQDMVLFNDSIYYNIAYGNLAASREQVEAAAKAARVSAASRRVA